MVAAVRGGQSMRSVARRFHVSLLTIQRWVDRARAKRLDRVDFSDLPSRPKLVANRTPIETENMILTIRQQLKESSDLGEWGASAIHRELRKGELTHLPSERTINRILERRGAFDARQRVRRRPPPPGWYLPDVAAKCVELDQFDVVSGLVIEAGPEVEVLNGVSVHGGLVASWPEAAITAEFTRHALIEHWRASGLPAYAQFDNDARFQGPHQHPDTIGSVIRLCLSLAVVPVFAPPREVGFQAAIEALNGRWQAKVWTRFHHESLPALQLQSAKYVTAARARAALRIEAAPARGEFPRQWRLNLRSYPRGRIIFVRRTNEHGEASVLGHRFGVDPLWPHRLVRCDVEIDHGVIRFFALRRREPEYQPLLREVAYVLPRRHYEE